MKYPRKYCSPIYFSTVSVFPHPCRNDDQQLIHDVEKHDLYVPMRQIHVCCMCDSYLCSDLLELWRPRMKALIFSDVLKRDSQTYSVYLCCCHRHHVLLLLRDIVYSIIIFYVFLSLFDCLSIYGHVYIYMLHLYIRCL